MNLPTSPASPGCMALPTTKTQCLRRRGAERQRQARHRRCGPRARARRRIFFFSSTAAMLLLLLERGGSPRHGGCLAWWALTYTQEGMAAAGPWLSARETG